MLRSANLSHDRRKKSSEKKVTTKKKSNDECFVQKFCQVNCVVVVGNVRVGSVWELIGNRTLKFISRIQNENGKNQNFLS